MAKSIKKNYVYNLFYQILTLITPLVTAPYIARVLEPEGIGLFSYAESVVSYFILFAALGTSTYGQREISYFQDDKEKRSEIFWNTKALSFITSLISLAIYFLFVFFRFKNTLLYSILVFSIINVIFDVTWFFQGIEEFGILVLRNAVVRLLSVAFIFVFIHSKDDFYIYAIGLTGLNLLSNLSVIPMLRKYISRPKNIKPFSNIKTVILLFIPTIATSIYTVFDKTMIGLFTKTSSENGYYEQAIKLSKMILMVVTSLAPVMIPRIGFYFKKNDFNTIKFYMYKSYRFVWLLGIPLYFGLFAVSSNLIPWFFGEGYDKVVLLLRILGLILIAIGISNVTGCQYLIPTKRQNLFTITVLTGAAVNFILNLILIPRLYSVGAAIASVIAEFAVTIVQLILVRKELSFIKIISSCGKYLLSGIVMFVLLMFVSKKMEPAPLNSIILITIGIAAYFIILFLLKDVFLIEVLKKISNKFIKK